MNKAQFSTNFSIAIVVVVAIITLVASNSYINDKAVKESYCDANGPFTCKEFSITTEKTSGNQENYLVLDAQEIEDVTLIKESLTSNSCNSAYFDSDLFVNTQGEKVKIILNCNEGNLVDDVQGSFELLYITSNGDVAKSNVEFNIKRTQTIFDSFQQEISSITESANKEIPVDTPSRVNTGGGVEQGSTSGGGGSGEGAGGGGEGSNTSITDNQPPYVSTNHIPIDTILSTEVVTINAEADDTNYGNSGIKEINIYVDSELKQTCSLATSCSYSSTYSTGTHNYYATALDNNNNPGVDPIVGTKSFTIISNDVTIPTITISHTPTIPSNTQQVTYTTTASDASGIKEIKIYVDNTNVETCTGQISCSKILGPYTQGSTHTYYATALDNNDNLATDPLTGTKQFTVTTQTCIPNTEICTDNIDNDCDNLIDCNDSDCLNTINCVSSFNGRDCSLTYLGLTNLLDLGTGYYKGFQGGLYPGGSNVRPAAHTADGIAIANTIEPLDSAGNPDPNGAIGLIAASMSNGAYEFNDAFKVLADSDPVVNSKLVVAGTAVGGNDITKWTNINDPVWGTVDRKLQKAGITREQVQVVWVKQALAFTGGINPNFPDHALELKNGASTNGGLEQLVRNLKTQFPNLKIAYVSSRTRAYNIYQLSLNPEPYAYESGFSVKWLIEDQINNAPGLEYQGSNAVAPWLSWGPYIWADGENARSDSFKWLCTDTRSDDGTHPSVPDGTNKVANELMNFFKTDVTAAPWFLENP